MTSHVRWLGAGLATLMLMAADAPARARQPNIVIILADDLGYADLGCQGSRDIKTPNIDGLASNGVRCTSGYAAAPVGGPTRAALLTGRYPQRFGQEFNPPRDPKAESRPAADRDHAGQLAESRGIRNRAGRQVAPGQRPQAASAGARLSRVLRLSRRRPLLPGPRDSRPADTCPHPVPGPMASSAARSRSSRRNT